MIEWCRFSRAGRDAKVDVFELLHGSDLLNLVVAKGYLTKLLANAAVISYIERKEPEILSHLELVANTVSMEEVVQ